MDSCQQIQFAFYKSYCQADRLIQGNRSVNVPNTYECTKEYHAANIESKQIT